MIGLEKIDAEFNHGELGYLYRYDIVLSSIGYHEESCGEYVSTGHRVEVCLQEYPIIKRTAKGVWINHTGCFSGKKIVLLDARKKFACETKEQALDSFIARKKKQCKIYESKLEDIKVALKIADKMVESGKISNCSSEIVSAIN